MNILPISTNNHPNFEHAIRVSYCVKKPNAVGYDYVNPRTNKELYKNLNSKVVGWLNEGIINRVREVLNKPLQRTKDVSNSETVIKEKFIRDFTEQDSDYKKFGFARSVYGRGKLGFLATGNDASIIENIKGATDIGLAKSESILLYGTTHTDFVREICKEFSINSQKYIAHPLNRLMDNGKEVLLRLNFRLAGKDKAGNDLYELDNYLFDRIKKPVPASKHSEEVQIINLKNTPEIEGVVRNSVKHLINQVSKNKKLTNLSDLIDAVLKPKKAKQATKVQDSQQELRPTLRRPRRKKVKDDPNQLKIPFVFED